MKKNGLLESLFCLQFSLTHGTIGPPKMFFLNQKSLIIMAFEGKDETVVIVLDLKVAYNRVQYDVLMSALLRLDVEPLFILWIGMAMLQRKVALRV